MGLSGKSESYTIPIDKVVETLKHYKSWLEKRAKEKGKEIDCQSKPMIIMNGESYSIDFK